MHVIRCYSVSPTKDTLDDDSANDMKIDRDGDMSELREQEDEEEIDEEQAGGIDEEGQKMEIAEVGDENDTNTPVVNNLDSAVITAVATENEDKKEKAPKKSSTIVPPENQLAVNRSRRVIEPRRGMVLRIYLIFTMHFRTRIS